MLAFCSLATNQLGTVRAAHMRFWGRCRFAAGYHNRLRRLNARQAGNDDQADQAQKRANNEPQQAASPFAPGNGRAGGCNDDPNYCNFHFFYLSVHLIGRILHYTLCGGNSARARTTPSQNTRSPSGKSTCSGTWIASFEALTISFRALAAESARFRLVLIEYLPSVFSGVL